jgi:predicted ester cyclase
LSLHKNVVTVSTPSSAGRWPSLRLKRPYELINAGDFEGFGGLLADDFVEHGDPPDPPPGREGPKQLFAMFRAGFPDMRWTAEDLLPSGDRVVSRVRVTGTHEREFMGIASTGKSIDVPVIDIIRFGDDRLGHEHWGILTRSRCGSAVSRRVRAARTRLTA